MQKKRQRPKTSSSCSTRLYLRIDFVTMAEEQGMYLLDYSASVPLSVVAPRYSSTKLRVQCWHFVDKS